MLIIAVLTTVLMWASYGVGRILGTMKARMEHACHLAYIGEADTPAKMGSLINEFRKKTLPMLKGKTYSTDLINKCIEHGRKIKGEGQCRG